MINETCGALGQGLFRCQGILFVDAWYMILILLLALATIAILIIQIPASVHKRWRKALLDLGHDQAYLDVIKSREGYLKREKP